MADRRVLAVQLMSVTERAASALAELGGFDVLAFDHPAALAPVVGDLEALVISSPLYTAELAALLSRRAVRLKWILSPNAGLDTFEQHGIPPGVALTGAGSLWSAAVAEHAIALLLALARRLRDGVVHQTHGEWRRAEWAPKLSSLNGRHLGIVGVGAIGREVAVRARGLGMRITGVGRRPRAEPMVDRMVGMDDLDEVLRAVDAVVLSLPLSPQTHHLLNRERIERLRPGAFVVNVARGAVIDTTALVEALRDGRLGGAGLDVFEQEPLLPEHALWTLENVILTPHIAGITGPDALDRQIAFCREQVREYLQRAGAG